MSRKFYESYKKLKVYSQYYVDVLSTEIINSICEIKKMNGQYLLYKNRFNSSEWRVIAAWCFNELKMLFWTRFCNQMRDYFCLIYGITYEKKGLVKEKYEPIWNYISESNFLKYFLHSHKAYNALSLVLHNLNRFSFDNENFEQSKKEFENFNQAFIKNDFITIKKEFELVISLFRKSDGLDNCFVEFDLKNNLSIFDFFAYLSNAK